jgi:hypothetical protein
VCADARTVKAVPFLERFLAQLVNRVGDVVPQARDIAEPQVNLLGIVFLGEFQYFL